jgi:hypothetical protein
VIEPGEICLVELRFTPSRELPDDPAQRAAPEVHEGRLDLIDGQGETVAGVELTGASIFLLPDLVIELDDVGSRGEQKAESVSQWQ